MIGFMVVESTLTVRNAPGETVMKTHITKLGSPFLTVAQVANRFAVSDKTVYHWVNVEKIPHHKINGSLRFRISDLEEWEISLKKGPPTDEKKSGKPFRKEGE